MNTFYKLFILIILRVGTTLLEKDIKTVKLPGSSCNPTEDIWHALKGSPSQFLYCDTFLKTYLIENCTKLISGSQKIFSEKHQQCIEPPKIIHSETQDAVHGRLEDAQEINAADSICRLPPSEGNSCSNVPQQRYYFNQATGECAPFTFNGCGSNENNFATARMCIHFCSSAACANGEISFIEESTEIVRQCNVANHASCPVGFTCRRNVLTEQYVCCGATDMGVCPKLEKAFMNATTQKIQSCSPNTDPDCPRGFVCTFNSEADAYFCCSSNVQSTCARGRTVQTDEADQPQTCIVGSTLSPCRRGYTCQPAQSGVYEGHCCSEKDVCPSGEDFYLEPSTNSPRFCDWDDTFKSCPDTHECVQGQFAWGRRSFGKGVCCKKKPKTISDTADEQDTCPFGTSLYLQHSKPKTCSPFVARSCPLGYQCHYSLKQSRYQCCGNPQDHEDDGCDRGQVAYKEPSSGMPVLCMPGRGACPESYGCAFSKPFGRYQCCGFNGGCPGDRTAHINHRTGQAETCIPGIFDGCPNGYLCMQGLAGDYMCCSHMVNETNLAVVGPRTNINAGSFIEKNLGSVTDAPTTTSIAMEFETTTLPVTISTVTSTDQATSQTTAPAETTLEPHRWTSTSERTKGDTTIVNTTLNPTESKKKPNPPDYRARPATPICPLAEQEPNVITTLFGDSIETCTGPQSRCSAGYGCQPSPSDGYRFVCCGEKQIKSNEDTFTKPEMEEEDLSNYCPLLSHHPLRLMNGGDLVPCKLSEDCPLRNRIQYSCQFSKIMNHFICCGDKSDTGASEVQTNGVDNGTGGRLQSTKKSKSVLDLMQSLNKLCPGSSGVYVYDKLPLTCSDVLDRCPFGYECYHNEEVEEHLCCSIDAVLAPKKTMISSLGPSPLPTMPVVAGALNDNRCPGGGHPYLYPGRTDALVCRSPQDRCPAGFLCQYSFQQGQFICCQSINRRSLNIGVAGTMSMSEYRNIIGARGRLNHGIRARSNERSTSDINRRSPGDSCSKEEQCVQGYPGAHCIQGLCRCPNNLLVFKSRKFSSCVRQCPRGTFNNRGVCLEWKNTEQ